MCEFLQFSESRNSQWNQGVSALLLPLDRQIFKTASLWPLRYSCVFFEIRFFILTVGEYLRQSRNPCASLLRQIAYFFCICIYYQYQNINIISHLILIVNVFTKLFWHFDKKHLTFCMHSAIIIKQSVGTHGRKCRNGGIGRRPGLKIPWDFFSYRFDPGFRHHLYRGVEQSGSSSGS